MQASHKIDPKKLLGFKLEARIPAKQDMSAKTGAKVGKRPPAVMGAKVGKRPPTVMGAKIGKKPMA